jgi:hypothetical protein
MWLDKEDDISLYIICPISEGEDANIEQVNYKYNDVVFCRYLFDYDMLVRMLEDLNSKGYYIDDTVVNEKLIGILNNDDFNRLNPGNLAFKAFGDFFQENTLNFTILFLGYQSALFSLTSIDRSDSILHQKECYLKKTCHIIHQNGMHLPT